MSEPQAPKINFPCDYPIKVMGSAGGELHTHIREVMARHAPGFDEAQIVVRDSAKGNFQSITVTIIATSENQLQAIHTDLRSHPQVKLVL